MPLGGVGGGPGDQLFWPVAICGPGAGAGRRSGRWGGAGRRAPRGEAGSPGRELRAHCGCTTSFLDVQTRGPGAPQPFPLPGRLTLTLAGLATHLTFDPRVPLIPSSPTCASLTSPEPRPALPNAPRTSPGPGPSAPPSPALGRSVSCPGPGLRAVPALLPPRPGPALTPAAALQSQAGSEAAAESIHGPSRTTPRRLPGPRRPRPPGPDLRGPDTFAFTRGAGGGRGAPPRAERRTFRTRPGPRAPGRARASPSRAGAAGTPRARRARPGGAVPGAARPSEPPPSDPAWAGGPRTYPRSGHPFRSRHTFAAAASRQPQLLSPLSISRSLGRSCPSTRGARVPT